MKVAVVIVSYNTRDLLQRCLLSVTHSARLSGINSDCLEIVVIDNASVDDSANMVAREFPQIRLIAAPENLGFTRANNLALAILGFRISYLQPKPGVEPPDTVLLLNPDAELIDDALGQMAHFLQSHPDVGGCGARLQYPDGSFQHGAFSFPTPLQVALDLFPIAGLRGAGRVYDSRANGRYPISYWNSTAPFPVDFALGAALMLRGSTIKRIGGLDEEYFMYCEEMDWCLRSAQAGMPIYAVPTAHVIHHEAQSSRQTPWPAFRNLWSSRLRFYTKHRTAFWPGHLLLVRNLVRLALRLRIAQAHHRFANGQITGVEAAEELAAYAYVMRL